MSIENLQFFLFLFFGFLFFFLKRKGKKKEQQDEEGTEKRGGVICGGKWRRINGNGFMKGNSLNIMIQKCNH